MQQDDETAALEKGCDMAPPPPRLAARAVIVEDGKLLLVNAFADARVALMCAPGGGVERGSSLTENLKREVFEETGLEIEVGAPCLINEFHDPDGTFHQVEVFFRASLRAGNTPPGTWTDPERIVTRRRWVDQAELANVPHKPSSLGDIAFGDRAGLTYDPLEPIWLPPPSPKSH